MVFVADALGGWLVGQLADAGRKKLTELVLGSEQERALRRAADVAVWATAEEVQLSGGEQAGQVAMVISEVFGDPVPAAPLAGPVMLLEGLQAGIAGQLVVLDDAGLTGTGQSSAEVLGVPGAVLADRLTSHLVREIIVRGSGGGPLAPLADQFNHELTRLQIGGMLAQLAAEVRDALPRPGSDITAPGRSLAEVTDPFPLEVHRPVDPDVSQPGLPALPAYVPREHDAALAEVVTAAAAGTSGIAVLVGGSSTGKTRACWQALELLRGQEPGWRLWHPVDPQGALAGLPGAGPRTVVWLNEAQRYLGPPDGAGERVAAGLRELLRDRARGPVLVLATLWPEFWAELTARPPEGPDPHAQARELLSGHEIQVPATFTPGQLRELGEAGDPRLAQAAAGSRDGQVIQYLAGAPELLARYHNAPPAAQALIHAAMDAARLGMGPALPRAFLEAAAPGYLTGTDWDLLPSDWLAQALGYTVKPCKGVRGPLVPIRPRPVPGASASSGGGPAWQLADYLEQQGRRARREEIPPAFFWAAAASCAGSPELTVLAVAAEERGLLRDAACLYKQAHAHGHPNAGVRLVHLLQTLHPGDTRPADWAAVHASLDDPAAVAQLMGALRSTVARGAFSTLLDRDPAAHASLHDPGAVGLLLHALRDARAIDQVTTLLDRDPAAHASLHDLAAVVFLLRELREAGASDQISTLASRAAARASLDNPDAVARLLKVLREARASDQISTLLDCDPAAHASLDNPDAVARLLKALCHLGATGQITALASRAAAHASLDNPDGATWLLSVLDHIGATGQVPWLTLTPGARFGLHDPDVVARLLDAVRKAEAVGQVATLLDHAAEASLDDPGRLARLLDALHALGTTSQVTALASRAAHASLDNPAGAASLLRELDYAGATGQVATLLDRDPAAHASLDNPAGVAELLDALHVLGTTSQVTALASRAAAHASLDNPDGIAYLLSALHKAAPAQAAKLIERLPAAGMFQLFCEQEGHRGQFRFGRETDGRPAKPWAWTDLG